MGTNYLDRDVEQQDVNAIQKGLNEAVQDLSDLVNKYGRRDLPLLVAAIKMTLPQMERLLGETGRSVADGLLEAGECICYTIPNEE